MPEAKIRARGGAIRWRRKSLDGKYINIAIVPKAGKRGGHTIAGEVHKKREVKRKIRRKSR